jgi:hypothetical protein
MSMLDDAIIADTADDQVADGREFLGEGILKFCVYPVPERSTLRPVPQKQVRERERERERERGKRTGQRQATERNSFLLLPFTPLAFLSLSPFMCVFAVVVVVMVEFWDRGRKEENSRDEAMVCSFCCLVVSFVMWASKK